jgi:hypothetical protein
MKRLIIVLAGLCLLLGSCFMGSSLLFLESDSKDRPNLVLNSNFEFPDKRNPNNPAAWLLVSNSNDLTEPVALDSTVSFSGKRSVRFTNNSRDMLLVSDAFKINFTGGFFIKCSIKSAKPMLKAARVHFWAYDDAGSRKDKFSKGIKAKTEWKKATISAGFLKNSVTFARIAIYIPRDPENTVWVDDIGCYQVYQFTKE